MLNISLLTVLLRRKIGRMDGKQDIPVTAQDRSCVPRHGRDRLVGQQEPGLGCAGEYAVQGRTARRHHGRERVFLYHRHVGFEERGIEVHLGDGEEKAKGGNLIRNAEFGMRNGNTAVFRILSRLGRRGCLRSREYAGSSCRRRIRGRAGLFMREFAADAGGRKHYPIPQLLLSWQKQKSS